MEQLKPHFRVVRFSPVPEVTEHINVALLVVADRPRLLVDVEFQKLGCVAPQFDATMLRFWLESIQEELRRIAPANAATFLATVSSQFALGEPQVLVRSLDQKLETRLIDLYLRRHRASPQQKGDRQQIESLLDTALKALELDPSRFLKRARPDQFLSSESRKILQTEEIQFARVLNGRNGLVLMDGINLHANKAHLCQRTSKVGASFFVVGQKKQPLEVSEGRKIIRAAFVFDGVVETDPEVQYAVAQLQQHSDVFVKEDERMIAPPSVKELLHSAVGGLL